VASGSSDGTVKLWNATSSLSHFASIPIIGFVNGLQFSKYGDYLLCGVGKEHRLGRWKTIQGATNGIALVKLKQ